MGTHMAGLQDTTEVGSLTAGLQDTTEVGRYSLSWLTAGRYRVKHSRNWFTGHYRGIGTLIAGLQDRYRGR